jgi:hypothetical protein
MRMTAEEWLIDQFQDFLMKVEWVRRASGKAYACPACGGIRERNGGPGHAENCEWKRLVYAKPSELLAWARETWR